MSEAERPSPPRYEPVLAPPDTSNYSIYDLHRQDKEGFESAIRIVGVDPSPSLDSVYPIFDTVTTSNMVPMLVGGRVAMQAREALDRLIDPPVVLRQSGLECYYAYMHMRNGGRVESWDMPQTEQFEILQNRAYVLCESQTEYTLSQMCEFLNSELDAVRYEYAGERISFWASHAESVVVTCERGEAEMLKNAVVASLAGFVDIVREVYEIEDLRLKNND